MAGSNFARQIPHVFPRRIQALILFWCWRLFQFLFIRNDLSLLEVLLLTHYSWCHLQHSRKLMAAVFCFHGAAAWPKQTVTLLKLNLWRAKRVLVLHLFRLCALRLFPNSFPFTASKNENLFLRLQANIADLCVPLVNAVASSCSLVWG